MKNIPLFTTEFGIAALVLEKIPYTGQAYIVIQKAAEIPKLLQDCVSFCCAAGAQSVYASADVSLDPYPLYTTVISMTQNREDLPHTDAVAHPVQKVSLSAWREIYNEKMREIPNAAFLSIRDSEKLLQEKSCYFVYRENSLLGIGAVGENTIKAVAAVVPGGGKDTLLALCSVLHSDTVSLEVAGNNAPAIRLYSRLGFVENGVISKWHKIK